MGLLPTKKLLKIGWASTHIKEKERKEMIKCVYCVLYTHNIKTEKGFKMANCIWRVSYTVALF